MVVNQICVFRTGAKSAKLAIISTMVSAKLALQPCLVVFSAETQTSAQLVLRNSSQSVKGGACAAKESRINIQTLTLARVNVMMAIL